MSEPTIGLQHWHTAPRLRVTAPHAVIAPSPPCVLLLATLRWPLAARLALAFADHDCTVEAWCPPEHPVDRTSVLARRHVRRVLSPLDSLRSALLEARPDIAVPCDDGAALELEALYRRERAAAPDGSLCALIERSLGSPAASRVASARDELMQVAEQAGVRVPAHARVPDERALEAFCREQGYPVVLKSDGSFGGLGVSVLRDAAEARETFRRMGRVRLLPALSQLVLRRDGSQLLHWLAGRRPVLTAQRYIEGTAANSALACWRGEVRGAIEVLALRTLTPTGPATVVRRIDHGEMSEAGRRIARTLGLSGLCGLDFVIERTTGHAYLIELNPRATPVAHLAFGPGRDLPGALRAACAGDAGCEPRRLPDDVIAMFPGELRRDPLSPFVASGYHDVPWSEPGLVQDCLDLPWEERGFAARMRARWGRRRVEVGV